MLPVQRFNRPARPGIPTPTPTARSTRLLCLAVLATASMQPGAASADLSGQQRRVAQAYASVIEWQGSFEVSKTGVAEGDAQGTMQRVAARIERSASGRFTLRRDEESGEWDPAEGMFKWTGTGQVTASNQETRAAWYKDGRGFEHTRRSDGTANLVDVSFSIWLGEENANFNTGWTESNFDQTTTGRTVERVNDGTSTIALASQSSETSEPGAGTALLPVLAEVSADRVVSQLDLYPRVSSGPQVFSFSAELAGDTHELVENQAPLTRSRVLLHPVYADVELEITIDDYAKWRPLGSIKTPTEPGSALVARATLKSRDGSETDLPVVRSFRFDLLDTTREPGVALNWPYGATDTDFDLRLAPVGSGTLSKADQALEVTESLEDDQGRPYAEARIASYDFGAAAGLMVKATLDDGREVLGKLKLDQEEQDIVRLPRRLGPDWVGAHWRETHGVEHLAADDDEEKVEGQQYHGDGYTLYEEYRGWVVHGRHQGGDPKAKDFFVLNLIGPQAEPGIQLFASLSQLRVHAGLLPGEMSQATRLMNGNHRDAPHRVKQHGVWVKVFTEAGLGDEGAQTVMLKRGVAGRPGLVKGIGILARDDQQSAFNKPYNLPVQDTLLAYDRAIAHELLHSVGVEHHGKGDYQRVLGYVSTRHPANRLGRAYFATTPKGEPYTVLDEAGNDVAASFAADHQQLRMMLELGFMEQYLAEGRKQIADQQGMNPGLNAGFKTPEAYANNEIETHIFLMLNINGTVGVEHGAHSGHQDCVMRYAFAKFYEKRPGTGRSLFLVTPGTERIGMQLCRAPQGTGINASSFSPQSRYGDAAPGAGSCFEQISPNDAIPPRETP